MPPNQHTVYALLAISHTYTDLYIGALCLFTLHTLCIRAYTQTTRTIKCMPHVHISMDVHHMSAYTCTQHYINASECILYIFPRSKLGGTCRRCNGFRTQLLYSVWRRICLSLALCCARCVYYALYTDTLCKSASFLQRMWESTSNAIRSCCEMRFFMGVW